MSKALRKAFKGGLIDNDEKEASSKKNNRFQDKSAKTIPYLRAK